ncbi:hypothetical protein HPB48_009807 [Haemaphysalis longicornis]|uniref:DH domain-containing protein n=1 Tax=Haemaphysalis longicornis TaxID=44386 RepID=A0A9J6H440_HAELO|nr:hypothetical protein HPB48_009807 [Haemaphysalis longicornis]
MKYLYVLLREKRTHDNNVTASCIGAFSSHVLSQEQESSIVFKKLSKPEEEEDEQDEFVEPPASALHRRQALVPPKGKKWEDFVSSLKNPDADSEDEDENESSGGSAATSPKNGNAAALSAAMAGLASSSASDNLLMPGDADRGSPTAMGDAMQSQFLRTINQTILKNEAKKKDALWELFQSELNFLEDHLMVLKNVFMEPLKKIQVEGYAMFAEPEVLFGNLDELCCVTYAFCKEFISFILATLNSGDFNTTDVLLRLFKKSTKAAALRQAYHRYTLNYINALNYLETLRRQVEFNEFEKWCARDPRCKKLQLTDLLVSPVQHIMRVPLILKEIETRTEDMEERDCITAILEAEENSLREFGPPVCVGGKLS